jgi:hypothetical protein
MVEKIEWIRNIFQALIALISLVCGIIYWGKIKYHGYLKLFPIYIAVSLLISCTWYVKPLHYIGLLIQNFFILFEFFLLYNFFIKVLKGKKNYIFLIALSFLFVLCTIIIGAFLYMNQSKYTNIFSYYSHNIPVELVVIENILIVVPVLFYYASILNRPYIKQIIQDPIFLAMTGILFCFTISTPIFAFGRSIWLRDKHVFSYLYTINALAYIIMHLFFIKAFKSIR